MTAIEIIRANPGLTAPELVRRFGLRDSTTDRCTEDHHSGSPRRKPEEYYTQRYGIRFYNLEDE